MAKKKTSFKLEAGWAIYLRTSSEDAQNPKNSQERQRYEIEHALLKRIELPTIAEYIDNDSGRKINRKNYQRMLADARAGKFSHIAVESPDRFGRNAAEALRACEELCELGIDVRFANSPNTRFSDPEAELTIIIYFGLAQFESTKISGRVRGGLRTKALNGGFVGRAPDGYRNIEIRTDASAKQFAGRYTRWIEKDPIQSQVWRKAWDLLLEDRYTLVEICQMLHALGYTFRKKTSFVLVKEDGRIEYPVNDLSRILHNWFYAGWVVSEAMDIEPKTIRGKWEALVTTEEFELGLEILARRKQKLAPKRKNFYLLSRLVALETADKRLQRLICSTPNTHRKGGGTPYYCVPSSNINILCAVLDKQVFGILKSIVIDPKLLPDLRLVFEQDIQNSLKLSPDEKTRLQRELVLLQGREKTGLLEYINGQVTAETWHSVSSELKSRRLAILRELENLEQSQDLILRDLEDAIAIISQMSKLYATLGEVKQRELLRLVVKKIIVNEQGNILRVELLPPFSYLKNRQEWLKKILASSDVKNATLNKGGVPKHSTQIGCSIEVLLGTLNETYHEHFKASNSNTSLLAQVIFPQKNSLQNLLHNRIS